MACEVLSDSDLITCVSHLSHCSSSGLFCCFWKTAEPLTLTLPGMPFSREPLYGFRLPSSPVEGVCPNVISLRVLTRTTPCNTAAGALPLAHSSSSLSWHSALSFFLALTAFGYISICLLVIICFCLQNVRSLRPLHLQMCSRCLLEQCLISTFWLNEDSIWHIVGLLGVF